MRLPGWITGFAAFGQRLPRLGVWARLALALVAGTGTVLALPPVHWVPLLAVTLPMLLWLLDGATSKRGAFFLGWSFGTGFFGAGLYWVSNALLVDAAQFGWLVPFAIGGLGLGLGLFHGLLTLAVFLSKTKGLARVLTFAALWVLLEMVRGVIFTGFPWNMMGTVWALWPTMMQPAAWIGSYGLSLLTVTIMSLPALIAWHGRSGLVWSVGGLLVLVVGGVAVSERLPSQAAPTVDGVRLRLVQPNIPQEEKWRNDLRQANLREHLALSLAGPEDQPVTHVIWGETSLPYTLDGRDDGDLRTALAEALHDDAGAVARPNGAKGPVLITGAVRRTPADVDPFQVWNSMVALDDAGSVIAQFDKAHLVPFGEYVPLKGLLPLKKITAGMVDFTPGPGPATVPLAGTPPVSPLICYEVIFPGAVTAGAEDGNRPGWLLNLTNDGWYGMSAGPYQHYATARLRAIEEGIPLVRVANTGISAIIDPWGREVARLELGQKGFVDGPLPQAMAPTVFARWGNMVPLLLSLALLGVGVLGRRRP